MSAASGGANRCLESPSLPSKSSSWKKPLYQCHDVAHIYCIFAAKNN